MNYKGCFVLFQIIDHKDFCDSIFLNNRIEKSPTDMSGLSDTWSYHPRLRNLPIQYASIYAGGKNLDEVCPKHLFDEWNDIKKKHFSFQKSFKLSKVSTSEHCFYDLVPENFSKKFFQIKNKISEHVLNTYPKPKNYDSLVQLAELIYDIQLQKLNLDLNPLHRKSYDPLIKEFVKRIRKTRPFIRYNMFGSITGRLSIKPKSFPILNLKKEHRGILIPNNDLFVEFDFNGSQLRTLLALNNIKIPECDIHEWNLNLLQNIYNEPLTREGVKTKIFSWLFNNTSSLGIPKLEKLYDKQKALDKWWDGNKITTPFGSEVEADEWHALNYLIQRTEADILFGRATKINKMLREKKSCIVWLIHDSIVIDFSMEDKGILRQIVEEFSNTKFGKWKVNVKIGKNFGGMQNVRI